MLEGGNTALSFWGGGCQINFQKDKNCHVIIAFLLQYFLLRSYWAVRGLVPP